MELKLKFHLSPIFIIFSNFYSLSQVNNYVNFTGAQFGTVLAMPISGFLSEYGFAGGWPSIFYVFGLAGTLWSIAFILTIYDDPESHPRIKEDEKKYIVTSVWGAAGVSVRYPDKYLRYLNKLTISYPTRY